MAGKVLADKSRLTISLMSERNTNTPLTLSGKEIENIIHLLNLGVTFDNTLRFKKHIHNMARVASMKLDHLRRTAHLLTPESMQNLYIFQIRSILVRGSSNTYRGPDQNARQS